MDRSSYKRTSVLAGFVLLGLVFLYELGFAGRSPAVSFASTEAQFYKASDRTAICVTGQARTSRLQSVVDAQLERLYRNPTLASPDLFFVLDEEDVQHTDVAANLKRLPNLDLILTPPADSGTDALWTTFASERSCWGSYESSMRQAYKLSRCLRAIEAKEASNGQRYARVIRSRPDNYFTHAFDFARLPNTVTWTPYPFWPALTNIWMILNDIFVVANRDAADALFAYTVADHLQCPFTEESKKRFHLVWPDEAAGDIHFEWILKQQLNGRGVWANMDFSVYIGRDCCFDGTCECPFKVS